MKKLISLLLIGGAIAANAASVKSYSFLDPNVSAFYLTNGINATNIESMIQNTNAICATNFSVATATCFMYTNGQRWYDPIASNYWVFGGISQTQYGVFYPGTLCVDVLSNISGAAGTFGVAPPNHTNTSLAFTNDTQNMFADVPLEEFYPPYAEIFPPLSGAAGTNAVGMFICTLVNTLTTGAGNSNYVTFTFVPVLTDPPDYNRFNQTWFPLGATKGLEVTPNVTTAGAGFNGFPAGYNLQPFTIACTNSGAAVGPVPQNFAVEIPMCSVFPAKALRIKTAVLGAGTQGGAAATGLSGIWVTDLRFLGLTQYGR